MRILIWHEDAYWRKTLAQELDMWQIEGKVELRVVEPQPDTYLVFQQITEFRPDLLIMGWGEGSKELLGDIRIRSWDLPVWVISDRSPREIHHEAAKADLILGRDLFSRAAYIALVYMFLQPRPARAGA